MSLSNRRLPLAPVYPDELHYEVENRDLPARSADVLRIIQEHPGYPGKLGIRPYAIGAILGIDAWIVELGIEQLTYRYPLWEDGERLSRRVGLLSESYHSGEDQ